MAHVISHLSRRGHFVVIACSSLGDDETVTPDLMEYVDEDLRGNLEGRVYLPTIHTWRDFVATLRDSDYLIASRLHGTILGFVTRTPVIAISFDPKVDWVMEDLNQTESLLHFRDFNAEDVLRALESIKSHKETVVSQISGYRQKVISTSDSTRQYAFLAELALNHHQSRI
jgi:polysaccharide pyruvyl transferase WcaK-like protein